MTKAKAVMLLLPAFVVLTAAVGLQWWDATFHPVTATKRAPLEELIPREIPGWVCRDLPLAQTEELKGRVLDRLNLQDHISRIYRKGELEVILYLAYWEPLQMPVRQAGSHTPEVCWVLNGWVCTGMEHDVFFAYSDTVLKSGEVRVLETDRNRQHVVYWHLIEGKVYKAANKVGMWDRWNMLTDHFRFGLNQKPEQYFIRISSNQPLERVWRDAGFQKLLSWIVEATDLAVPAGEDPDAWTYRFII